MEIQIKRIDASLPLPKYHTSGSAGFDLYARISTVVPPRGLAKIPSNLIVATPPGYLLLLSARSSLAAKKGLCMPNGVGIVDSDYAGPADEILISVYNFSDKEATVERGERIVQGVFIKVEQAVWNEVLELGPTNRGGFGSTG